MTTSIKIKTFIVLISFCTFGCKNDKSPSRADLMNLELLRGDVVMCSGEKFGDVDFSLSCDVDVRATFDLAVSLLHSFQYSDAEKAFVQIIDLDPDCAMAYWGVAMSIYHAAWFPPSEKELIKASRILEVAQTINTSAKESDYLNAIRGFYTNWDILDHKTRAKKYEMKMEGMHMKYPNDAEVAIFYTLALYSTRDRVGKDYINELKAGKILENLFEDKPNHPGIAHYIIHNYDNPELAPMALPVARRYAEIAPGSAHAQHMPSHIFTRLGLWEESIESNAKSISSVQCFVTQSDIKGHYFEEVHAMDYLVYAFLQKGDNTRALEQYQNLKMMHDFYPMTLPAVAYPLAAIPARLALENRDWQSAAEVEIHETSINWDKFPWQKAIVHFTKALGAAHMHDFDAVEVELVMLNKLHQNLIDLNDPIQTNQIGLVMVQIKTVEAWVAYEKGNKEEGLALMKEASQIESTTSKHPVTPGDVLPADELLGDMLLEMDLAQEALIAYEKNLEAHPSRFNGIYGAAMAAKMSGNEGKAKMYFEELLDLAGSGNGARPEIDQALSYLGREI